MKRFFCVLLFIAAVIGGLLLCDHVTRRDDSERKFRSFYDEKQDLDVFFMGTEAYVMRTKQHPFPALSKLLPY